VGTLRQQEAVLDFLDTSSSFSYASIAPSDDRRPDSFGPVDQGFIKFFFLNLFNIYSLNTIRIEIQASNDYSSQNKIQEHFITQENMQQHEMQQIIIYLYK
jgi:hypothetical protein